jgi:hypothetical protein
VAEDTKVLEVVLELRDLLSGKLKNAATQAKTTQGAFAGLTKTVVGLAAAYISIQGLQQVVGFLKDCAKAAMEEEGVIVALNAALKSHGNYTAESAQQLRDFSKEMMNTTTLADDQVLVIMRQVEALAGLSATAIPDATRAVIGLSTAIGMDYSTAANLMSKTLTGQNNLLARSGIIVDMNKDAYGRLIDIMNSPKIQAGLAMMTASLGTSEGATKQLVVAWEEMKESIGSFATDKRAVDAVGMLTESVKGLTKTIDENKGAVNEWIDDVAQIIKVSVSIAASLDKISVAFGNTKSAGTKLWQFFTQVYFPALGVAQKLHEPLLSALNWIASAFDKVADAIARAIDKLNIFNRTKVAPKSTAGGEKPGVKYGFTFAGVGMNIPVGIGYSGIGTNLPSNIGAGWKRPEQSNEITNAITIAKNTGAIENLTTSVRALGVAFGEGSTAVTGATHVPSAGVKDAASRIALGAYPTVDIADATIKKLGEVMKVSVTIPAGKSLADSLKNPDDDNPNDTGTRGGFAKSFNGLGDKDFLMNLAGAGIGSLASGGGAAGMASTLLPLIGSAFGPIGVAVSGLLGGLFGKKKNQTPVTEPIPVKVVNLGDLATAFLAATQSRRLLQTGPGMNRLTTELSLQGARVGVV